jgi:hypothetical protein
MKDWGYSSVVEHRSSMCKALDLIPRRMKRKKKNNVQLHLSNILDNGPSKIAYCCYSQPEFQIELIWGKKPTKTHNEN